MTQTHRALRTLFAWPEHETIHFVSALCQQYPERVRTLDQNLEFIGTLAILNLPTKPYTWVETPTTDDIPALTPDAAWENKISWMSQQLDRLNEVLLMSFALPEKEIVDLVSYMKHRESIRCQEGGDGLQSSHGFLEQLLAMSNYMKMLQNIAKVLNDLQCIRQSVVAV